MRAPSNANRDRLSRRRLLQVGTASFAGASLGLLARATAAPVTIHYATGGGIGPNEMETIIYLDYLKENVLKN
jgi:NitT/TauT family transport system substrate-binding protein